MIFPLIGTILLLLLGCTYIYIKNAFLYWKREKIPYLKPELPFGNIKLLIFRKLSFGEMMANLHVQLKKNGEKFGGFYALTIPSLAIIDPDLIRDIYVRNFTSFCERGLYYNEKDDPLSTHLAAIRNPKWQRLRNLFSPIYTPAKIKMVCPILNECAEEMVLRGEDFARNNLPFDARDFLSRYTTDIIVRTALGIECNTVKNPDSEFRRIGKEFFGPTLRNSIILSLTFVAPELLRFFKISVAGPDITKFFIDAIKRTIEYREDHKIEEKDFMTLLIKLKNNQSIIDEKIPEDLNTKTITFEELAAQAFIFFLGGFETSSGVLTFALYELAKNEKIQDKLRQEIMETINGNDGKVTYDVLMDMKYLDCCFNELLRKYPIISTINRECVRDCVIPGTDKLIKKGTKVVTSLVALHNDPEYFPDPEKFDPDRFSDERKSEIRPNTYCPFGVGPRNCIGYRFGMMSVKMGLAIFLKNFKVTYYPGMKIPEKLSPANFMLDLDGPLWLKLTKD